MIPKMFQVRFSSQKRTLLKSRQHLVKRGPSPEESCEVDTDDTGRERAARRARLALVEQVVFAVAYDARGRGESCVT